jgi:hypothetical protein
MRLSEHVNIDNPNEHYQGVNRYLIYCRKSSESDERQIQSLNDQMHF